MKTKHFYFTLVPLLIIGLSITAFKYQKQEDEKSNFLKFSHTQHSSITETCEDCHSSVVESTSLNMKLTPTHDNCSSCHATDDGDQCSTCHYEDVYEPRPEPNPTLIFNHKYHIQTKGMNCITCHKGFDGKELSSNVGTAHPSMAVCYTCHNDFQASNACESCHISTANLRPQSHTSSSFMKTHKFMASKQNADCMMCHDNNSCESCHAGTSMLTEMNTVKNFYRPYSPHNLIDGARIQQITRVHEMNYRFTHGIDAKGKSFDCQSCHQTETFCAECHNSGSGDYSYGGIVPTTHLQPGFFTLGVGSGGGQHAILAKRDIERCVSCHDTNGGDPTCITCHLDNDGIKGTNPKTHASGFMKNEKGDWHDSQGSICYNCHTNASPSSVSGVGFCGYCHGGM